MTPQDYKDQQVIKYIIDIIEHADNLVGIDRVGVLNNVNAVLQLLTGYENLATLFLRDGAGVVVSDWPYSHVKYSWDSRETFMQQLYKMLADNREQEKSMPEYAEDKDLPFDAVDRPVHYANRKFETIEVIEDALTPAEYRGFLKGQVLKYLLRDGRKQNTDDLGKAGWYMKHLLEWAKEYDLLTNSKERK